MKGGRWKWKKREDWKERRGPKERGERGM